METKRLQGRRALITGASRGFGLAIAHAFAAEGANLMLCARTASDLDRAKNDIMDHHNVRVLSYVADVSLDEDVYTLVADTIESFGGIEILVCCAGIYGPKGPIQKVNVEDWVRAIEINLLGTMLPCRAVLDHMMFQKHGKIIVISGGGATKPMPNLSAYAASKAAVVRFAETIAEEVRDSGIDINSVAPGALNTRLLDELLEAGPDAVGRKFYEQAIEQKKSGGTPMRRGTDLCTFLASDESNGITGKLISAVWDPWRDFKKNRHDLDGDVYTLRRVSL